MIKEIYETIKLSPRELMEKLELKGEFSDIYREKDIVIRQIIKEEL